MGMPSSKFGKEVPKNDLQEGSLPSTPILTPKAPKLTEMDPRSPSLHIARTPLELLSSAVEKLELLSDANTPVKNKCILGIDPRSPTTDFKRTPIIIDGTESDFPRKLRNKNLDKVRQAELHTSPIQVTETSPKPVIPPKLLQSSPIKPRPDAYKRRSLAGLLETNIDFTETDLDSVLKEKYNTEKILETEDSVIPDETPETVQNYAESSNNIIDVLDESSSEPEEINQNKTEEILNDVKTVVDSIENSEEIENNVKTIDNIENFEEIENNFKTIVDNIESSEQVENDSQEHEQFVEVEHSEGNSLEVDIPNETKSAPVSPPNIPFSPILPSKDIKSAPITPPLVNLTADVKELDKKLTNLIYEDDLVVCPRIVKLKDNTERSPLRNCNGNEFRVKAIQKLKVSDRPRRSEYAVSKIPVFKEKKGKMKEVQCENTPPRNIERKVRSRKSDWDTKDNTLYL